MQAVIVSLPCSAGVVVVRQRSGAAAAESARSSSSLASPLASTGLRLRQVGVLGPRVGDVTVFGAHGRGATQSQQRRRSTGRIVALASDASIKWVLEAVGDGTTAHLGESASLPSSFELTSDTTNVGRIADKVDVVLDIPTVSGLHAKLEKKENVLYVTDLRSTNGTFVEGKKIKAGVASPISEGSTVTFGDEHLAIFKFTTIEGTTPAAAEDTPAAAEAEEAPLTPVSQDA